MRGTIRQRSKGSWQLIFDAPREADGKRRQARQTIHGTKKEAEAKLRELLTAMERGDYVAPTSETMGAFLRHWLDNYAATHVSPRTYRDYDGIVRRYLQPALGGLPLARVKPQHVQGLHATLLGRGLSPRTVLHTHRVLSEALSHAVKWQLVARNVCDAVDAPRPERKEMAALDAHGVARLLAASEATPYRDLFSVAIYTGLRRSELLGLRWTDVDLDRGRLSVVAGLHRLTGKGLVLLPTKTARSRRSVSVGAEALDTLRHVRMQQLENRLAAGPAWHDTGFVFTKGDGSPIDPEKVTHAFARVARGAGLTGVRFHDLRHTHASLMLQAGVHPKVVSERLGHASVTITLDTYSHVLPGLQEDATARFSEVLATAGSR